jgi:hypothetical protein
VTAFDQRTIISQSIFLNLSENTKKADYPVLSDNQPFLKSSNFNDGRRFGDKFVAQNYPLELRGSFLVKIQIMEVTEHHVVLCKWRLAFSWNTKFARE